MSMPIQRQSEQFSVFDTGTRWERDRPSHELPRGLAGLVNNMGPRIQGGMLNTRTAENRWVDSKDGSGRKKCKDCGGVGYGSCVCKNCDKCGDSYYGSCDCGGSKREAGWNYPEWDRTEVDDYDHDLDRPSAADFAEEDFERERKRNYPRGQGPAWNYDEDGDPDPYLEHLEETSDPERFISGSRRRLAVEEDYSGGDEDDPDWIRENSPRQQEHNRKRGEEISRSKDVFGSRHPFDRAAAVRLADCQQCGERLLPREGGWYHVDNPEGEYDHDPEPDDDDIDNDEYGEHLDPAEPYEEHKYRELMKEYGIHVAKGKCTCWEGYERVPGTEPCSEDSCRKESMRLAYSDAGVDDRNVRPGPLVDAPLYEQDPDDFFGKRPYSGPYCPDCGNPMPWVSGPYCRHGKRVAGIFNGRPDHPDVSWQETADGWEHPVTGCQVRPSDKFADEWEMVAPTTSKRKPYSIIDHHTDPHAMMARHDRTTGYAPKTAEVMQAQPQVPIAGGYLPGHQVYSLWRGEPRHGIVTALEAPNTVWVRYHDGQHLPENPGDIQLR